MIVPILEKVVSLFSPKNLKIAEVWRSLEKFRGFGEFGEFFGESGRFPDKTN
jgi:hypothetical protein